MRSWGRGRKDTFTPDSWQGTSPITTRASSALDTRQSFLSRWRQTHSPSPCILSRPVPKVVSLKLMHSFKVVGSSPGTARTKREGRKRDWGKLSTAELVQITMRRRTQLATQAAENSQGKTPRFVRKAH